MKLAVMTLVFLTAASCDGFAVSLNCRTQVSFSCKSVCLSDTGPADLSLDFDKKTGSFCRGEQCDDGVVTSKTDKGQWNDKPYTMFTLRKKGRKGFFVSGVVGDDKVFSGVSNELGQLVGTCE